jgi:hypothetical protein
MKKIIAILIGTLLSLPCMARVDVYQDNFDDYSVGEQVAKLYRPWSYVNVAADNGLVADTQSASSPNSLHFESTDTETGMAEYTLLGKTVQEIEQGSVSFKFYLDGSEDSNWLFYNHIAKDSLDQELFILQLRISPSAGILAYPEGTSDTDFLFAEGVDVTVDEWHELTINFDHPAQTYDILYDGDTLASGVAFQNGDALCKTHGVGIGDGSAVESYNLNAYIDDVLILSANAEAFTLPPQQVLRFDDFESATYGPPGPLSYLPNNPPDTTSYWQYKYVWFDGVDTDLNKGVISDTNCVSPSQSLYWNIQTYDNGMVSMFSPELMEKGVYKFKFYFDSDQQNQWIFIRQGAKSTVGDTLSRVLMMELRLSSRAGIMHYPDGYGNPNYWYTSSITHDVWHEFSIIFDHSQHKYSLALDGYLIVKDQPWILYDTTYRTNDFRIGNGHTGDLYYLLGYIDDMGYSVEAPPAEPEIIGIATVDSGLELTLKDIGASVSQRIMWTDDLGVAWQEAAVVAGDAGTWIDSGDIGRTDPCDPSVNKRFYKVNLAP